VAVNVTTGRDGLGYVRSSSCGTGACVEVAQRRDGSIAVRDSKNPSQPELVYTREEWVAFIRGAKSGEFDFGMSIGAGLDSATVRFAR
jgi:hypothetical protein